MESETCWRGLTPCEGPVRKIREREVIFKYSSSHNSSDSDMVYNVKDS